MLPSFTETDRGARVRDRESDSATEKEGQRDLEATAAAAVRLAASPTAADSVSLNAVSLGSTAPKLSFARRSTCPMRP